MKEVGARGRRVLCDSTQARSAKSAPAWIRRDLAQAYEVVEGKGPVGCHERTNAPRQKRRSEDVGWM